MKRTFAIAAASLLLSAIASAEPAPPLVVTFAGDYGATPNTTATLQRIEAVKPEAHFAIGDLSYSQLPEQQWCDMVHKNLHSPFLLVPGNHESDGENGDIRVFEKCLPYSYGARLNGTYPDQYYVDMPVKKPIARFILISADLNFTDAGHVNYTKDNASMQWLKSAIADAKKSGIRWVIVGMHKVCITTWNKSCDVGEVLMHTLMASGVDVVMAGHVHAYERTYQLSCMTALTYEPGCVAGDSLNEYTKGKGTVFVTAGTGGVNIWKLKPPDAKKTYFAKILAADNGSHYGPAVLRITDNQLAELFLDAKTGEVLDSFTIQKR